MILSMSGVVLLGIIVFLFFRKDGLKASHAMTSALFGFYLASTAIAPSIKAAWREPGEPPGRDQVLTSPPIARTFRRQQWPGAPSPASSATAAHRSPEAGSWPGRQPTAPPTFSSR